MNNKIKVVCKIVSFFTYLSIAVAFFYIVVCLSVHSKALKNMANSFEKLVAAHNELLASHEELIDAHNTLLTSHNKLAEAHNTLREEYNESCVDIARLDVRMDGFLTNYDRLVGILERRGIVRKIKSDD